MNHNKGLSIHLNQKTWCENVFPKKEIILSKASLKIPTIAYPLQIWFFQHG